LLFLSPLPPEPDSDFELSEELLEPELSLDLSEPDEPSPDEPSPDEPFDPLAEAPAGTVLDAFRLSVR
jgi:hypothetical protein